MSIRYKEKTVKVIDRVTCDICGKNTQHDYADINAPFDGGYEIHFCEPCFKMMLDWAKQIRNPSIYTKENDPMLGKSGKNWHIKFI